MLLNGYEKIDLYFHLKSTQYEFELILVLLKLTLTKVYERKIQFLNGTNFI